ncbi:MAG: hypothetical protein OXH52_02680, partial [Gammaproteobacteria bacterium]|nr:hypothetical protein [Gammaproteobacteria bacterium]
ARRPLTFQVAIRMPVSIALPSLPVLASRRFSCPRRAVRQATGDPRQPAENGSCASASEGGHPLAVGGIPPRTVR